MYTSKNNALYKVMFEIKLKITTCLKVVFIRLNFSTAIFVTIIILIRIRIKNK